VEATGNPIAMLSGLRCTRACLDRFLPVRHARDPVTDRPGCFRWLQLTNWTSRREEDDTHPASALPSDPLLAPLCQEAAGRGGRRLGLAGPGCGLSEVPVWGVGLAALESESLPRCPPGLAPTVMASAVMVR
jgi:hypothetical protein